ncbi:MAG: hypothetical protein CVU23_09830 [Betaproteobacteria bacterium HGW-Betaproteobacteria-17]|nr:MAG: hypothetical protein CVU23_09830 [Betaproteobacteria bacterium HGW-Betaproteobacteria-17]
MRKTPSDEYLEKARLLSEEETERLLSRARSKLIRKLESEKMTALDVVALQLEIEDEDLSEWRAKMAEIRKSDIKKKAKAK